MGKLTLFFNPWISCSESLGELHPFTLALREYKLAFSWQRPAETKARQTYYELE